MPGIGAAIHEQRPIGIASRRELVTCQRSENNYTQVARTDTRLLISSGELAGQLCSTRPRKLARLGQMLPSVAKPLLKSFHPQGFSHPDLPAAPTRGANAGRLPAPNGCALAQAKP
jgi:hypothetical protein